MRSHSLIATIGQQMPDLGPALRGMVQIFRMERSMRNAVALAVLLALSLTNAAGQGKTLTNDPLTRLPLIPATVLFKNVGNEPDKMPDTRVCRSRVQGNVYSLSSVMNPANGVKMEAAAAWYASHLSGFKKVQGYADGRPQIAFFNSEGTIVVFLTGQLGAKGENTDAFSVSYERCQPGISEKAIAGLTQGEFICN